MKTYRISKSNYLINGRKVFKPLGDKLWRLEHSLGYDYALTLGEAKRIIQDQAITKQA